MQTEQGDLFGWRPRFDGATFEPEHDADRLKRQLVRVYAVMADCQWRTLTEIEDVTGDPPASVSARLRDLRKQRFGAFVVARRARGSRINGLYEYRLQPPQTLMVARHG